jgi:hypothetical protein
MDGWKDERMGGRGTNNWQLLHRCADDRVADKYPWLGIL